MRTLGAAFVAVWVSMTWVSAGQAADLGVRDRQVRVQKHKRVLHGYWCPNRYSCSPLYGAYGPYGGQAYWRAYTAWWRWR
jgi:hypothetical protein